jgi:hypothetical protein
MSVITGQMHKVIKEMLPDNVRAEIVDGEIIMNVGTPFFQHALMIRALRRAIGAIPGLVDLEVTAVGLPATEEEFVPDLAYYYFDEVDPDVRVGPAHSLVMAVEVLSGRDNSNSARRDRKDKAQGYAASGVPLYLLVDQPRKIVTLHSKPTYVPSAKADRYSTIVQVPYGGPLELPAPFDRTLDTSIFGS